jgi:hypothetical protein
MMNVQLNTYGLVLFLAAPVLLLIGIVAAGPFLIVGILGLARRNSARKARQRAIASGHGFRRHHGVLVYLLGALACYVLAKVTELRDQEIYAWTGEAVSGHVLKHLLAAAGLGCFYFMLAATPPYNH